MNRAAARARRKTKATTPPATPARAVVNHAPNDPPTYREVAAQLGWTAAADRVNRWAAAGYEGHYSDNRYAPSPQPKGGAA